MPLTAGDPEALFARHGIRCVRTIIGDHFFVRRGEFIVKSLS